MTYKSALWQILFYGGLVVTALAQLTNPGEYGIPLDWVPYIKLLALIAAVVGGKLGASPLPKEPGATPGAGAGAIGVALLTALSLLLGGCAAFTKAPTTDTQQAKLQQLTQAADLMRQAGVVAGGVQQLEIAAYDAGQVPAPVHRQIQQGFLETSQAVQAGLAVMQDLAAPTSDRRAAIDRVLAAVDQLLAQGVPAVIDPLRREQIRSGLTAVRGIVGVALTVIP